MLNSRSRPEKKFFARAMRKDQTPAERILWELVRRKQLGPRFQRQSVILGYIADFYCASRRLVVEVDGSSHIGREGYDAKRDAALWRHQITTLRFTNDEVINCPEACFEKICESLDSLPTFHPLENFTDTLEADRRG